MANEYLQKQTALAKQLRKKNPKLNWIEAVKKAATQLKSSPKKVGAYKVIEKGETPKTKVRAVYQITRGKKGTFKKDGVKRVAGLPKVAGVTITPIYKVRDVLEKELQMLVKNKEYYKQLKPTPLMTKTKIAFMVKHYTKRIANLKVALRNENASINNLLK